MTFNFKLLQIQIALFFKNPSTVNVESNFNKLLSELGFNLEKLVKLPLSIPDEIPYLIIDSANKKLQITRNRLDLSYIFLGNGSNINMNQFSNDVFIDLEFIMNFFGILNISTNRVGFVVDYADESTNKDDFKIKIDALKSNYLKVSLPSESRILIETQSNIISDGKTDVELRRLEASEGQKIVNNESSNTYFVLLRTDFNHHHNFKMEKSEINTFLRSYLDRAGLDPIKSTFNINHA